MRETYIEFKLDFDRIFVELEINFSSDLNQKLELSLGAISSSFWHTVCSTGVDECKILSKNIFYFMGN